MDIGQLRQCFDCQYFNSEIHHDEDQELELDTDCHNPHSEHYTRPVMAYENCSHYVYKGVFKQGTKMRWI